MTSDDKDKREARSLLLVIVIAMALLMVAGALFLLVAGDAIHAVFAPGLGLKQSAVIAFFVTTALLIVFAISAGDGLLGELQFVLGSFFTFFVIIWLMIAWIF